MALSASQIVQTYPGIRDDADIDTYIELARLQTSSSFYGTKYELAVALRAAHNITLSKPKIYGDSSMKTGSRASRRQQDLSESFYDSAPQLAGGATTPGNKLLTTTVYGQQLLQLMSMSNTSMRAVGTSAIAALGGS